jgi:hypothetical protein
MRRRCAAALLAAALSITLPLAAHAKTSLQGRLALSAAWTDNVLSVGLIPSTGQRPESDFYYEIAPSLLLATGGARMVHRLNYAFVATLFTLHPEANSYNHRLDWAGYFQTSPTTELFLTAAISQGRLNTIALRTSSATTPVQVQQAGGQTFMGANVTELFGWDITSKWRFTQSAALGMFFPLDPRNTPQSFDVDQHLIFERAWRKDALNLDLRVDYVHFSEVRGPTVVNDVANPNGVVTPSQDVFINSATLRWRHDFGHFWNSELNLGIIEASRVSGGVAIIQPAAMAAMRYLHEYGSGELMYQHGVQPNVIVAQTFVNDMVALRGSVPLGLASHVVLSTAVAYNHARVIDFEAGGDLSRTHLILADATLTYIPRLEVQVFARYQFFDQVGSPDDFLPQPNFRRHTVMLGIIGTYPGEAAAVVPSRDALRVDRSDAVGIQAPARPAR